ncbi:YceI family protein [uncultured Sphingomonas sp.]|uniref:YceI family protein n=1 Tax=uncultured Sphingomonas sp. TaxID=158754 RepID=UPI0025F9DB44|nr:YceI family protein [uncultured Sphingomonas sp.]
MRLTLTAAALALAAASAGTVAQTAPGSRNVAAVTGGSYTADPAHTQVTWTVDHMGFTPLSGMFGDISGTLMLDPKNPSAAKVDLTIPVSKLVNPAAGLTQHMFRAGKDGGKPDFFGPNPADAKFVSTAVRASGESATITGNLTLNGVTRPVTLQAKFYGAGKAPAMMGGKENVGFTATGMVKRSDFGLGLAVPIVSDDVKLTIHAAFQK